MAFLSGDPIYWCPCCFSDNLYKSRRSFPFYLFFLRPCFVYIRATTAGTGSLCRNESVVSFARLRKHPPLRHGRKVETEKTPSMPWKIRSMAEKKQRTEDRADREVIAFRAQFGDGGLSSEVVRQAAQEILEEAIALVSDELILGLRGSRSVAARTRS